MSQNRKAPSYQEYASDILAQLSFRTITLQDRGLLWTLRMECWVNKQLPNNPNVIAKALGLPVDEVVSSLPAVMSFFKIEGDFLICPELEDYRTHLNARKIKQSKGGKIGSTITNKKLKANKEAVLVESTNLSCTSSTNLSSDFQVPRQVPRRGSDESGVESSTVEQSQVQLSREEQSLDKEVLKDPFVSEMEEYEVNEGIKDKKRFMRI